MNRKVIFSVLCLCCVAFSLSARDDRREVRRGNRDFRKDNYKDAELHYRRALVQDSTSFAATYDLANTLYLRKDYQGAKNTYENIAQAASESGHAYAFYFNRGDNDLRLQDYKAAVEDFKQALLLAPDDLAAKESYIYAKKKLEEQNRQQQDQNQKSDGQDQEQDRNNQGQDKQDQDNQQQDNQQDNKGEDGQQQSQPQISQQQAQQMLKAIQAKEKETQDKVEKAKAAQVKSRQKEKNW